MNSRRKHLSAKEKSRIIDEAACISRWGKQRAELLQAQDRGNCTIHNGKDPVFSTIDQSILDYFRESREMELPVKTRDLILKASTLDGGFRTLSESAKRAYLERLKSRNDIVLRRTTHLGQKKFEEIQMEAIDFQSSLRQRMEAME